MITQNDNREFEKLQEFVTLIKKVDDDFGFEELLELFEFVISPADKLVNGAIYTPKEIRKYIRNSGDTYNYCTVCKNIIKYFNFMKIKN